MVQKSQGQPPFGCIKSWTYWENGARFLNITIPLTRKAASFFKAFGCWLKGQFFSSEMLTQSKLELFLKKNQWWYEMCFVCICFSVVKTITGYHKRVVFGLFFQPMGFLTARKAEGVWNLRGFVDTFWVEESDLFTVGGTVTSKWW